jgi:hypothetical protein
LTAMEVTLRSSEGTPEPVPRNATAIPLNSVQRKKIN